MGRVYYILILLKMLKDQRSVLYYTTQEYFVLTQASFVAAMEFGLKICRL